MAKKSGPPPNVARLPPEEQISYLVQQHEEFSDWRIKVDERLDKNETSVDRLSAEVHELKQSSNRVETMQAQILVLLTGQRTPGLERPGLTDDFKGLREEMQGMKERQRQDHLALSDKQTRYDQLHARIGWILIGFGGVSGIGGIALWPKIIKIIDLLK